MANAAVFTWNITGLHYWFNDDSHTMNAVVFNYEFLGIDNNKRHIT